MDISEKDTKEKLLKLIEKEQLISVSFIQRNLPCGFVSANKYIKYLLDESYIKESSKQMQYIVLSKEERKARRVILKDTNPEKASLYFKDVSKEVETFRKYFLNYRQKRNDVIACFNHTKHLIIELHEDELKSLKRKYKTFKEDKELFVINSENGILLCKFKSSKKGLKGPSFESLKLDDYRKINIFFTYHLKDLK